MLRVAAFTYPPYTIVEKNTIDGIEMRIAFLFCRLYNCTIETVYDDGLWGTILGNGSGDGKNIFIIIWAISLYYNK